MRLDFNVLWVDDQPNAVKAQITSIENKMALEGFKFNPRQCASIEEVTEYITEDVFHDEVDLILVDYDLGQDLRGQDVIEKIRRTAAYKDIIFYSAHTQVSDLRLFAFNSGLEGIYCASRTELVEEVIGVFESLVKKVLDLDHTRGIVMGATSDIDHIVRSCLLAIERQLNEQDRKALISDAINRVNKRIRKIIELGQRLEAAEGIETILMEHMIFGAADRLRMLYRLLERNSDHSHSRQTITAYLEQVVPDRNVLGHMVLAPEGRPQAVATNSGNPIHLDDMRELRKAILGFREHFRNLLSSLDV